MKKVLITGMTAQQASTRLAKKNVTFAGSIVRLLQDAGCVVEHREPWLLRDRNELEDYSAILVGVAPITSLSANNAYGALSVLAQMLDDDRTRLMVDSSDPEKIVASLRSLAKQPENLTKPLYRARKGYSVVVEDKTLRDGMHLAMLKLLDGWRVRTLYPASFCVSDLDVARRLGTSADNVRSVGADSLLLSRGAASQNLTTPRTTEWSVDSPKLRWFTSVEHTLTWKWSPAKAHKGETDDTVRERFMTRGGVIIPPSEGGLFWWNPRVAQAINTGTVVVSDWKITSLLGEAWSYIPATLEQLSHADRLALAVEQRDSYVAMTKTTKDETDLLVKELKL